ncbi:hypothetical protein [Dyadobacter sp. CY343]|uniref:hypothetical protein n=1 Tax=Dyadobacter sp. CY343 TaxID=2907299 RepID=UPI001F2F68FA|nr:hypothetical protein [Dyadobacter sp. CY343]MCE7063052.1 hypothetical protein [Dyadobacter sp. CY343]
MKVILDIKDSKAGFVMGLLQRLPFVKAKPISKFQAEVLDDVSDAVNEMHLIKNGKLAPKDAEDLSMNYKVLAINY